MPDVTCFFLTETDRVKRRLRRYHSSSDGKCPIHGYHDADFPLDVVDRSKQGDRQDFANNDPRWPKACACGYVFTESDEWQLFVERLFTRSDGGSPTTLRDAPPGAMWFADWMIEGIDQTECGNMYRGPDGHCLVVKCPDGHEWMVDSRASNCGSPDDNIHKCWVRHGIPPLITVDKNGLTCSAGAGSIQTPKWHGFLRNGVLTT